MDLAPGFRNRLLARLFPGVLVILASLPFSSSLNAQVAGSISGYIKDTSGAAVPSASITVVSGEQQLTRSTTSDVTGFYNLLAMQSGIYEVSVSATGFE